MSAASCLPATAKAPEAVWSICRASVVVVELLIVLIGATASLAALQMRSALATKAGTEVPEELCVVLELDAVDDPEDEPHAPNARGAAAKSTRNGRRLTGLA